MPYRITDQCIGCTACAKSCPVEAIKGAPKQQHEINIHRCISCGVCGRICPKGTILDGHGNPCTQVPKKDWKKPVVDTGLCSACGICVSYCRAGALRISAPAFHGDTQVHAELADEKKCVGCGLCQRECPLHAIHLAEVTNL